MAKWNDYGSSRILVLGGFMFQSLIACFLVGLVEVHADTNPQIQPFGSDSGMVILAPLCKRLGFNVTEKPDRATTVEWEKNRFGMVSKSSFFLKSKFPSGLSRDHFYRFTVWSETFPDSVQARIRLDSISVMPPKLRIEAQYVYGLQEGYQFGNRVVFVQTDVSAYTKKVGQLKNALRNLEGTVSLGVRNRMIDSLSKVLRMPN